MALIDYVRALETRGNEGRGLFVLDTLRGLGLDPVLQRGRIPPVLNIVVDFGPALTKLKRPLFCAHYDSVRGSPGANDNGSSVAVALGLCEELAGKQVPARVVFFDKEEAWFRTPMLRLGLLGSLYYVWKAGTKDTSVVYNLELCGAGDQLVVWPVAERDRFLPAVQNVEYVAARLGMPVLTAHLPWYVASSDHLSFRLCGFPNAVTLSVLPRNVVCELQERLQGIGCVPLPRRRPAVRHFLGAVHSKDDCCSNIEEGSLRSMLRLLVELTG